MDTQIDYDANRFGFGQFGALVELTVSGFLADAAATGYALLRCTSTDLPMGRDVALYENGLLDHNYI